MKNNLRFPSAHSLIIFLLLVTSLAFGQEKYEFSLSEGNKTYYYRNPKTDTVLITRNVISGNQIDKLGNEKKFEFKKGEAFILLNYENASDTSKTNWDKDIYWIVYQHDTLRFKVESNVFDSSFREISYKKPKLVFKIKDIDTSVKLVCAATDTTSLILVNAKTEEIIKPIKTDSSFYYNINGIDSLRVTFPDQLTQQVVLNDLDKVETPSSDVDESATSFFDKTSTSLGGLFIYVVFSLIALICVYTLVRLFYPQNFKRFEDKFFSKSKPVVVPASISKGEEVEKVTLIENAKELEENTTEEIKEPARTYTPLFFNEETLKMCTALLNCLTTFQDFKNKTPSLPDKLNEQLVKKYKGRLDDKIFDIRGLLWAIVNGKDIFLESKENHPFIENLLKNDRFAGLHQYLNMNGFRELVSQTLIYLQEIKNMPVFGDEFTPNTFEKQAETEIERFRKQVSLVGFEINYIESFSLDKQEKTDIEISDKVNHSLLYMHYIDVAKSSGKKFPNKSANDYNILEVLEIGVWSPKNEIGDHKKTIYIEK